MLRLALSPTSPEQRPHSSLVAHPGCGLPAGCGRAGPAGPCPQWWGWGRGVPRAPPPPAQQLAPRRSSSSGRWRDRRRPCCCVAGPPRSPGSFPAPEGSSRSQGHPCHGTAMRISAVRAAVNGTAAHISAAPDPLLTARPAGALVLCRRGARWAIKSYPSPPCSPSVGSSHPWYALGHRPPAHLLVEAAAGPALQEAKVHHGPLPQPVRAAPGRVVGAPDLQGGARGGQASSAQGPARARKQCGVCVHALGMPLDLP